MPWFEPTVTQCPARPRDRVKASAAALWPSSTSTRAKLFPPGFYREVLNSLFALRHTPCRCGNGWVSCSPTREQKCETTQPRLKFHLATQRSIYQAWQKQRIASLTNQPRITRGGR